MTITITNKQLLESADAIRAIGAIQSEDLVPADAQKLTRWLRKLNTELEAFNVGRQALLKQNWKTVDGERTQDFIPEDVDKFEVAQEEFQSAKVELKIPPLTLSMLGKKHRLTLAQRMSIDWWLGGDDGAEAADGE